MFMTSSTSFQVSRCGTFRYHVHRISDGVKNSSVLLRQDLLQSVPSSLVSLWVLGKLDNVYHLLNFVGGVQACSTSVFIVPLGVPIPVVAGYTYDVSRVEAYFLCRSWMVLVQGYLVVGILATVVVYVIQGAEIFGSIWVYGLHDLICKAANLEEEHRQC